MLAYITSSVFRFRNRLSCDRAAIVAIVTFSAICFVCCAPKNDAGQAAAAAAATGTPRSEVAAEAVLVVGNSMQDSTAKVVAAAQEFIATLSSQQRDALSFSFDNNRQRARWSNLPTGLYMRTGLRLGDLTPRQQNAMWGVLAATLSPDGYRQVQQLVIGEELLARNSRRNIIYGSDEYYFSILGAPSLSEAWAWQFGGHHLALNATIVGTDITLAPSLLGAQPVRFTHQGEEVYQLQRNTDSAFSLLHSLSDEQKEEAIQGARYINLVAGPGSDGQFPEPIGVAGRTLNAAQKQQLLELIALWVGVLNAEDATVRMEEIAESINDIRFAWYGPTAEGEAAYYRIHGPNVFIEYAPQQLGGSATNHIHTVYRNPQNDYGVRVLKTVQ